ncbi:hypothetical protein JF66_14510 [Cryobacterium sp. MLB-32]|uniref:hypothetical protein n=1 Tax=Cryobacterium sp. MLB-32 TaxID=1529318 RepID=UPI0004E75AFA|nr:hypothetical protein [Cryobacterium sp. MLB-32]KFF58987.1 hypothetical protein JF66_14510 [Cryobacterium sp. MLB-32]
MSDPQNPQVPDVPDVPSAPETPSVPPVSPPPAPPAPPAPSAATPPPAYGAPTPPPAYGAPTPPPPAYGAPANPYQATPYAGAPAKKQPMLSIFAMIAGVIGLVGAPIAFIPFVGGFLGLFFPAAGVVLGFMGKKREPAARGFWLTGIITGFVALALMLLSFLLYAILFATANTSGYNY